MTRKAADLSRFTDRMTFRRELILLEDGKAFGEVMAPWQEEDFAALDSGQYRHAYLERPRGHSKTGDIGTEAVVQLFLGPKGQSLYCAAADEDQARLLFEDVAAKCRRHPLLAQSVRMTQREVAVAAPNGTRLRVISSDAPSAYGLRPDWIAIDELAEWRRRELWDSLWSATGKRPNCRVLVISTAGWDFAGIAWQVRQIAEREPDWYFSPRGQCASWIRPEWLEQQRRTLPPHVFARLHECRWVEGAGAWLTQDEVDSIFADALPRGAGPVALGVDLGVSRNAAVAAVVRRDADSNLVIVETLQTWQPRRGNRVDLQEVEDDTAQLARMYGAPLVLDPWQGVLLAQRLRAKGVQIVEYTFTPENRRKLFSILLDLIRGSRLRCRPHEALRRELLGLEVSEHPGGWRVDHRRGGQDDHVVALGLAIQQVAPQVAAIDFKTQTVIVTRAQVLANREREGTPEAVSRRLQELEWDAANSRMPWD